MGGNWKSDVNLAELINGIKQLIYLKSPIFNPSLALNREAALQFIDNFNRRARKWTKKYAQNRGI